MPGEPGPAIVAPMSDTAPTARQVGAPPPDRPLLIYDGTCGFCRLWVERWRAAGGDRLDVAPSQEVGARFPEIPTAEFDRAVQLVGTDGAVFAAADAVLRARAIALRRSWLLAAYQKLPGFAGAAEGVYRFVAGHRPLLSALTRFFWGPDVRHPTYGVSSWMFLRLLGVVNLIAFASYWIQFPGLTGRHGILPAGQFLDVVRTQFGTARFWELPTLCWFFGGAWFIHVLCAAGVILSVALIAGVASPICLLVLWAAYLSLCGVGQIFYDFQWDSLLIEATLLAILLVPWRLWSWRVRSDPPRIARWLLWWLLIRLMMLSGAVKLLSGDPNWWHLTALYYHFQTQPLPTWVAWYANQLPHALLRIACAIMFFIELGAPLMLLLPRRVRHAGVALLVLFQALIALTGNYTFFNLLTASLCLLFVDDAFWREAAERFRRARPRTGTAVSVPARWCPRGLLVPAAVVTFGLTGLVCLPTLFQGRQWPHWLRATLDAVEPLRSFNTYGLFRVMTTERPEIVIEGSDDGLHWRPYAFEAKPGNPRRRPGFVAPYQPRLDWRLWFAALYYPHRRAWVTSLCVRLLQGSRPVLALFASNPFPKHPPREIRAVLYDYSFSSPALRAATGKWWVRTPVDFYVSPLALRSP